MNRSTVHFNPGHLYSSRPYLLEVGLSEKCCTWQVPTDVSSYFSVALVRAAARADVRDAYVCGAPGNRPRPYAFASRDGKCLPPCLFDPSCPAPNSGLSAYLEIMRHKSISNC